MNQNISSASFYLFLCIYLNEALSHCLLHSADSCDPFLVILGHFLDTRKNKNKIFSVCETV